MGRVKRENLFFYLAFCLYLLNTVLNASLYTELIPRTFFRLVDLSVVGILVVKWLISESFGIKKFLIWCMMLATVVCIVLQSGYVSLALAITVLLSAEDAEFDNLLKIDACILFFGMILVILTCKAGLIPDYTFSHRLGDKVSLAHSLGFKYYSTLGFMAMTLSIIYLYFQKNCSYLRMLMLVLVNYLFYRVHSTNLSFYLTLLFMAGYVIVVKWKVITFQSGFWKFAATILPVVLSLGTLGMVLLYRSNILTVSISFLNTIRNRFVYTVQAIDQYGIHLLGAKVEMYGNTELEYGDATSAFYIDSGYMYSLIAYGIIFTCLIVFLYTIAFRFIYDMHKPVLYMWMTMILAACCINNFLLSPVYNPMQFLIPAAIMKSGMKKVDRPGANYLKKTE